MHAIRQAARPPGGPAASHLGRAMSTPAAHAPASAAHPWLRDAEAFLGQAELGLREAGIMTRRGDQAHHLASLSQRMAPQAQQLARESRHAPLDARDPAHAQMLRRLAAVDQAQALLGSAARWLGAHASDQRPEDRPLVGAAWRARLNDETLALMGQLSTSGSLRDSALTGLLLACAPGPVLRTLCLESLPLAIHHHSSRWRGHQAGTSLSLTHWLALRVFVHPDSGAATTLQALDLLFHLDPDLLEAAAPVLGPLSRQLVTAVASAARLPGLGMANPSACYHAALPCAARRAMEEALEGGGEWLVGRPLPARLEASAADAGLRRSTPQGGEVLAPDPEGERDGGPPATALLRLQSQSAQAGAVRALRVDIFHPPQHPMPDRVLLMPGQRFRLADEGEEDAVQADGRRQTVRRYSLDKIGEDDTAAVPGTLAPASDPGWRAWALASRL